MARREPVACPPPAGRAPPAEPGPARPGRARSRLGHQRRSVAQRRAPSDCADHRTGGAIAWQLETGGPWHVDLSQTAQGGVLGLHGPTDLEHQFARTLQPGESFRTVAVALCAVEGGDAASSHSVGNPVVDDIAAQLTSYRRWLLRHRRDEPMPLVYNDFMNTLMGQPSTQALIPLVKEAGALGLDVFCIDAGWFASPAIGDWWATIGEWNEAKDRFDDGGLARICEK